MLIYSKMKVYCLKNINNSFVHNKIEIYSEQRFYNKVNRHIYIIYIDSRTPAFGGISLALRGRGASGATFGRLGCPRLGACGAHLENRRLRRR